jgi:cell division transport system permease protein
MMTIRRIIKLGLTNFWRNRWLSLAASLMIMLTLLTMGVFAILNIFVNSTAEGIKDRIDLTVYFYENATETQIKDLQYKLVNRPDVKQVKYVSKDEAFDQWQKRAINSKVKSLITKDANPLPRSLQVKANQPEAFSSIAQVLASETYKPFVREISYQKTKFTIDKLIRLTYFIGRLGWVLTTFLLLISLTVVLNTIRLTIFTRRDEIEIMRLVGANNAFIRIPFSVEAILYGVVGTLLAYSLICAVMSLYGMKLASYFFDIAMAGQANYFNLIEPYFTAVITNQPISFGQSLINLAPLGLLQLIIGIIFSVSCSMIALRRYLKT